jgi:hypothetical protein
MPASGTVKLDDKTKQALAQVLKLSDGAIREFVDGLTEVARTETPPRVSFAKTPKHLQTWVVKGYLSVSINHDRPATGRYRIFTQTGYGGYVHEGTVYMDANPFFIRALHRVLPDFENRGPLA